MTRKTAPKSLPVETYRQAIEDLQSIWSRDGDYETRTGTMPVARFVFALSANSFAKAKALAALWDADLWSESMPIVRNCFESAILAGWTQQSGQAGVDAIVHNQTRQNLLVLDQADKAGITVPQTVRDAVQGTTEDVPRVERKVGEAKYFERLCARISGGSLYLLYRHLSSDTHAAGSIAKHLHQLPGGEITATYSPKTDDGQQRFASSIVAYSLVWAGRAFSETISGKPGKSDYRRIAKHLQIPPLITFASVSRHRR